MMRIGHSLLPGIAAAMLVLAAPQAIAQDQPQAPAQPAPQPPPKTAQDFSQQQLEAFADAAIEMQRIQSEIAAKGREAKNLEEITRLQQQARADATQAVEASGLSVEEYDAIAQAANEDPRLYAMIVGLMQKKAAQ